MAFREDIGNLKEVPKGGVGNGIFGGQLCWMDLSMRRSAVCEQVWCWGGLDWSADGQAIVFSGDDRGRKYVTNLCVARLERRVVRYITYGKGNNYDPSLGAVGGRPHPPDGGTEAE